MKQKRATRIFISVKKHYRQIVFLTVVITLYAIFIFAKNTYGNADFGKTFGKKARDAEQKLTVLEQGFELCAELCQEKPLFLKSIVFPEVMRYNELKDDIETESLRALYIQFGAAYANFSIGLFQMKPSFADEVENKAKQLLPDSVYTALQLDYGYNDEEVVREKRISRLEDEQWQQVYLCAFVCICKELYKTKAFKNDSEKLQWYATVYNAGFDKPATYLSQKITAANFYLSQGMPGKKFKYAAIAKWFYEKT